MNTKTRLIAVTVSVLSISFSSILNAALIKTGTIVNDTDTGLEWSVLTETTGYSYNQMLANFNDVNSQFYGFTYATRTDIEILWGNAGYISDYNYGDDTSDVNKLSAITDLYNLFGQTGTVVANRADGMYNDSNANTNVGIAYLIPDLGTYGPGKGSAKMQNDFISPDDVNWSSSSGNDMGSWIYKDVNFVAAVPVPTAVWLFGSGLIGLIGVARRKKS